MILLYYQLLFSWMPVWFQVVILGLISILSIIIVFKIVKLILDAIPFV